MAAGTRRYSIELIVNTQQMQQAGQQANQVQQQVQQGATGVASAIQGAVNSVAKYVLGIQGIRMAWNLANREIEKYIELKERMDNQQKSSEQQALAYQRDLRQHIRNEGGFEDPSKIPAIKKDAADFIKSIGFTSDAAGARFLTTFSSDVAQYIGDPGEKGKMGLISNAEGAKFRRHIGESSVLSNVDPDNATKVAGAILGSTDWNALSKKTGKGAGALASAQYERAMGIMSRGRGDINTNAKNYARLVNEMVQVDRDEGRITGDDALDEAAVMIREISEYNPDEAEVFARNWTESSRMFSKKGTKEQWAKAGLHYDKPIDAARKTFAYFKSLRASGKVEKGKTFIDWIRNDAKVQIRGAAGGQAIAMAEAKGLGKAAIEGVAGINADTVEGGLKSLAETDEAYQADKAARQESAQDRAIGAQTTGLLAARVQAMALVKARGEHGLYDPRGYLAKGGMRGWNPANWFGGTYDDEQHKNDVALYRELATRNHPGMTNEYNVATGEKKTVGDWMTDRFYSQMADERSRQLNAEIALAEKNGIKVIELLEKLVKFEEAKKPQAAPVVPNHGQQGGMVKP